MISSRDHDDVTICSKDRRYHINLKDGDYSVEEVEQVAVDIAGCLPLPPIPAIPAIGFPLLPPFNVLLPELPQLPGFMSVRPDELILERLMALAQELGLEVDLDLDLSVSTLISEMQDAAGPLGAGQAGKLTAGIAAAMASAVPEIFIPPVLPIVGIPAMGFPLLPPFNVLLPELPGLPSFVTARPDELILERLMALAQELGLEVDLGLDLSVSTLLSEMQDAATQLSAGQAGKLTAGIAAAMAAAVPEVFVLPILPITGIPMLGFPMVPSFNFDVSLGIDCPLSKLAEWA